MVLSRWHELQHGVYRQETLHICSNCCSFMWVPGSYCPFIRCLRCSTITFWQRPNAEEALLLMAKIGEQHGEKLRADGGDCSSDQ